MPHASCLPQHNTEAEWRILHFAIFGRFAVDLVGRLSSEEFYGSQTRKLFAVVESMVARKIAVDDVTILPEIKDDTNALHDLQYVAEKWTPAVALDSYVEQIKSTAAVRAYNSLGHKLIAYSADNSEPGDIARMLAEEMSKINRQSSCDWETNQKLIHRHLSTLESRHSKKAMSGVTSGLIDLDSMTGGWRPGQLIFVGAVPKAGKTSLALHFALHAQEPTLFFTLEMMPDELADRMISVKSEVPAADITQGKIKDDDWSRVIDAMANLEPLPIGWVKKQGLGINEIMAVAQRYKQEHGLGLIVIDQLDKISEKRIKGENRTDQIGRVTRGLKEIAMALEVPVVCLVQLLDKQISGRKSPRPTYGDVRDSSYPDQDADVMIYLWRPAMYYPDREDFSDRAELIISRQRAGPTGSVWVRWQPDLTKVQALAKEYWPKVKDWEKVGSPGRSNVSDFGKYVKSPKCNPFN